MKTTVYTKHAALRREFDSLEELGAIINKGVTTVCHRLSGKSSWKAREKALILDELMRRGIEAEKSPEIYEKYFGGEA